LAVPAFGPWLLQRARRLGKPIFGDTAKVIRSGNWFGNDTTWRLCLDLNKLVLFGNSDGTLRPADLNQQKTYLSFVDGIIGGQGDGPMDPDPLESRVILFGTNPVSVDAVAAALMGFDLAKIPIVHNAFHARAFPLIGWTPDDIKCISNHPTWNATLREIEQSDDVLAVKPHFGWRGHVEARQPAAAAVE
jgi:hypothetical protein